MQNNRGLVTLRRTPPCPFLAVAVQCRRRQTRCWEHDPPGHTVAPPTAFRTAYLFPQNPDRPTPGEERPAAGEPITELGRSKALYWQLIADASPSSASDQFQTPRTSMATRSRRLPERASERPFPDQLQELWTAAAALVSRVAPARLPAGILPAGAALF